MQSFSRITQFLMWFPKQGRKYASERQSICERLFDCLSCRKINVELEVTRLQVYSSSYKSTLDAISKLVISDFYGYNNLFLTKKYNAARMCFHFISNSATSLQVKLTNLYLEVNIVVKYILSALIQFVN